MSEEWQIYGMFAAVLGLYSIAGAIRSLKKDDKPKEPKTELWKPPYPDRTVEDYDRMLGIYPNQRTARRVIEEQK